MTATFIVGAAARLAGVEDISELSSIRDGEPAGTRFSVDPDRIDDHLCGLELGRPAPECTRAALLSDFRLDWRALKLPPLQAERMHRMERVAIGLIAAALEDAGMSVEGGPYLDGRVIIASSGFGSDPMTDHSRRIRRWDLAQPVRAALEAHAPGDADEASEVVDGLFNLAAPPIDPDSLSTSASMAAGRAANCLDIRGGHLAIDVGVSSSMAALEVAQQLLARGDTSFVVVCGISPLLSSAVATAYAASGLLAAEGAPRPLGGGHGLVLGEGGAALVLADARAAARAPNRYGELMALRSAPLDASSDTEQTIAALARAALDDASLRPHDVTVVESRAAGLPDEATEARALRQVYGADGPPVHTLADRIGFLGPAAGMVSALMATVEAEAGPVAVSDVGLSPFGYHAIIGPVRAPSASSSQPRRTPPRAVPLAVLGLGIVAPGANDREAFWHNVTRGAVVVGDLPESRFDVDALLRGDEDVARLLRTRLAGTVDLPGLLPATEDHPEPAHDIARWAAREAWDSLHPNTRERLRHEVVDVVFGQLPYRWAEAEHERRLLFRSHLALAGEALTDLGLEAEVITQVLATARTLFEATSNEHGRRALELRSGLATSEAVAKELGLVGQLSSVDAACASSLAALEVASLRLASRQSDAALVGGVAFNLLPEYYVSLSILGALSPRGAPPFDVGSDGFIPAEGGAVVVLKRLEDAEAQGDPILAVIEGLGTSSDGAGRSVFAPSAQGQELAIRRALDNARIEPADVDYVEAHGTGTRLGDATELEAYERVFAGRDALHALELGTVKSQIGHQSSAAGLTGLVKVIQGLNRRLLPPSNADTEVDPEQALGGRELSLSSVVRHWPRAAGRPRRAGVSAFGLGGVNYHAVLREADGQTAAAEATPGRAAPRPGRAPARGPRADRLRLELAPLSLLPVRRWPLAGKRVVVIDDGGSALADRLLQSLTERSALATRLDTAGLDGATLEARAGNLGPIDLWIDTSWFTPRNEPEDVWAGRLSDRLVKSFALARGALPSWERPGTVLAVLTSLGGDIGFSGHAVGELGGAAMHGLLKGLRQEISTLRVKAIDFGADAPLAEVVSSALDEIEEGNERMEVGYVDRRFVPVLRQAPMPDQHGPGRAPPGTYLFSGGGRGIVFECAAALAGQGVRVVVSGRRPRPPADDERIGFDEEELERWLQNEAERRHRDGTATTPVAFDREVAQPLRAARELEANLRRAERLELPLTYEVCDVRSPAEVTALVERVRAQHGPIVGVVHGAMVEHSTSLARKTEAGIRATLDTKVGGALNLLRATVDDPVEVFVGFGSGAGRFGNRGQSDYCAANNQMAALIQAFGRRRPRPLRTIVLDWTAWSDVGAAVRDPDLAQRVRETGVTQIHPSEGAWWFLGELSLGDTGERLFCQERLLDSWPGLTADVDGVGPTAQPFDDKGRPLLHGRWPMISVVHSYDPGRVVAEKVLDARIDRYLSQHTLHGAPILPAAFGIELVAEMAQLLAPGQRILSVCNVEIHTPARVQPRRPLVLRLEAERKGDDIEVRTTSTLVLQSKNLQHERLHHRATVQVGPEPAPRQRTMPEEKGRPRARSFFHLAEAPIGLGPVFSRAEWITIDGHEVRGEVRAPRQRDLISQTTYPQFVADPLVLDAAFQIAANWDGYIHGYVSVPIGVDEVRLARRRQPSERTRVLAELKSQDGETSRYDLFALADDDTVLFEVKGLALRRVGEPQKA